MVSKHSFLIYDLRNITLPNISVIGTWWSSIPQEFQASISGTSMQIPE